MTNTPLQVASLQLTFDDEFTSFNASPTTGWSTRYPFGGDAARTLPANHEAEYYSDSSVGVNPFTDVNGVLNITAAPAAAGTVPAGLTYTSGVITTAQSFSQLYGYFEMSAELPAGQGMWPAFWLMPADGTTPEELDVMEMLGNNTNTIYQTTHGNDASGANAGIMSVVNTANTAAGFHTYGVDWEPDTITFYVDGKITAVVPTPATMHSPMYMIANLAVGAAGSWPGATKAPTTATMQIDYIRAYATAATTSVAGGAAILQGAITGQVVLAGAAQSGVMVSLVNGSGTVVATTTSSASGGFAFTGEPIGSYTLITTLASGQTLAAAASVTTGQTTALGATAFAPAATVSGSVMFGGVGQAGATVTLVNAAGQAIATTTTSATGGYSFSGLVAGTYQVQYAGVSGRVLQPGGQADSTTRLAPAITLAAGQSVSLPAELLVPAATVSGSVLVNGLTASAGVSVSLLNAAGTVVATTTTSATGGYSFGNLEAGAYQVKFTAPTGTVLQTGSQANSATGLTQAVSVVAGQSLVLGAESVLSNPATITGTVHHYGSATDPVWGNAQANVGVSLVNNAGSVIATTVSDQNGWFVFRNIAAGSYQFLYTPPLGTTLKAGGSASTVTGLTNSFTVAAGQSYAAPTGSVIAAAAISGQVLLSGTAEAGVAVSLVNASGAVVATTSTTASGGFLFNNIAAGTYQVLYTPPAGQFLQAGGPAAVGTGLSTAVTAALGVPVTLAPETLFLGGTIGGSVVFAGAPQAGVAVTLLNSSGGQVATTTSNTSGAFSFSGLQAGSYQVQYAPPAGELLQTGSLAAASTGLTAPIAVTAGQVVALGAETLVPAFATIAGSVQGDGVAQAGVSVSLLDSTGHVAATTVTSAAGAYSFGNLASGSYQVQFTAPAKQVLQTGSAASTTTGLAQVMSVAAGQTATVGTENLLANPARIEGGLSHFGSADPVWGTAQSGVVVNLLNASGTVIASTVTGGSGWFAFSNIAAGTYQVQYTPPAGEALQAGGTANVTTGLTATFAVTAGADYWLARGATVSSSNSFTLSGTSAVALRGAGSYVVTGTTTSSTLVLGAGNQSVSLTGTGDHITIGAGTSTINAGQGGATVHAAGGNVTITAGGANNLLDSGPGISFLNTDGSAGNNFLLNAAGQGLTTITGFNPATTDVLDLARTLAGTSILPSLANVGSFVTASFANGNTTLYVDPTGTHAAPSAFAVLNGVNTSVSQLLAGHHLSLV